MSNANANSSGSMLLSICCPSSRVICVSCHQIIKPWSPRLITESPTNKFSSSSSSITHYHLPCVGLGEALSIVNEFDCFPSIPGFCSMDYLNQCYARSQLSSLLSKAAGNLSRSFDCDTLVQGRSVNELRSDVALVSKSEGIPHRIADLLYEQRKKDEGNEEKNSRQRDGKKLKQLERTALDTKSAREEHEIRAAVHRERERALRRHAKNVDLTADELQTHSLNEVIVTNTPPEKVREPVELLRMMKIDNEEKEKGQPRGPEQRTRNEMPNRQDKQQEQEHVQENEPQREMGEFDRDKQEYSEPGEEEEEEEESAEFAVTPDRSIDVAADLTKVKVELSGVGTKHHQSRRGKKYEQKTAINPPYQPPVESNS